MIAIDSNILVYGHRPGHDFDDDAFKLLRDLAKGSQPWAIPYPCVHEFVRNVTDPRIYANPTPLDVALDQIAAWAEAPSIRLLSEGRRHVELLSRIAIEGRAVGAKIHDARIAAICLDHGVSELWTADRDFSRFPDLRTRNPFVG